MLAPSRTAFALLTLLIASCATVAPRPEEKLIGRWQTTSGAQTAEYVFASDGMFRGFVAVRGVVVSQFTGRWAVEGSTIAYDYTADRYGAIPAGTKDRDRILAITQDYFLIEAADGSRRKYVRVQSGG